MVLVDGRVQKPGFTLMELIIAIAILGILAVIIGPRLIGLLGQAKDAKAKTELMVLKDGIMQYYSFKGNYPTNLIELVQGKRALVDPDKTNIKDGKILDPWDQPYVYRLTKGGKHPFDLYSLGDPDEPGRIDAWQK